jgi:branched-chain amino acid transport system substrate-binding protein
MKKVSQLLGLSLLAVAASWPALAETPRSIKIGVLNDASGPYADNAGEGSVTAAKMAAEDFMHKHPDFKVEIISADHQNKADVGSAIAAVAAGTNDAQAIIGKMKQAPIDDDPGR